MMSLTQRNEALGTLSDDDVIERVQAGETAWFEILMRRYNQRLFRAARAIVRDDAEAEDVVQDAYVRAYQHLSTFAGRAAFSTWLTKIAIHEAFARVRDRRRMRPMQEPMDESPEHGAPLQPAPAESPEQAVAERQLARLVELAIDELPDGFREVFVLRAVQEMSLAETAACLEIPEATVKTRLFRARALLQKKLAARTDAVVPQAYAFAFERCDRIVDSVLRRIA
jgi:RNA polymerase sigma-70 factor (ECF subfamily)